MNPVHEEALNPTVLNGGFCGYFSLYLKSCDRNLNSPQLHKEIIISYEMASYGWWEDGYLMDEQPEANILSTKDYGHLRAGLWNIGQFYPQIPDTRINLIHNETPT